MTTTPYARANERLHKEFLPYQEGKTFSTDDVYRFFQVERVTSFDGHPIKPHELKHAFQEVLWNISRRNKTPELEQIGNRYRVINKTLRVIKWWENANKGAFQLNWPRDIDNPTAESFPFAENILIFPGGLIIIAGEGNQGKTAFCLNMLVENMDNHPCYYFSSEPDPNTLADRFSNFDWVNLYKEDGTPKFTVVEQLGNWQDVIQPEAINIVDWLKPPEKESFAVRDIILKMKDKLTTGILIVAMQKRSYKEVAEGGEGTVDYSSAYFTLRNDEKLKTRVLRIIKVKRVGLQDLNYKEYSFKLVQSGSRFHDIQEIK